MKLKSLLLTVAILAAFSAGVFYLRRSAPPPTADPRIGQPLIDPALVDKAARLQIADQGKTVTLIRQPNGTWRVASYYDFPADFAKLSGFIGSLTEAKLQRLVTSSPERIARLEFKDTKVTLLDTTGKDLWSLTFGKSAETGGGRFVRYGNEPKAFLASLNAWLDTDAKNWADSELPALKAENIAKIEIPFADSAPVTVTRVKAENPWAAANPPAGKKLMAEKITSLLNTLGKPRFTDTSDLADPAVATAKARLRTFKLTTFDGKTVTVALGRKPEEKKPKPTDAASPKPADAAKAPAPEIETIPAGPVYVFATNSDAAAPINALMAKRAFQISDYVFTSLPQRPDELFEAAPPLPAAPVPSKK